MFNSCNFVCVWGRSPTCTLKSSWRTIRDLLSEPNSHDLLNTDAANMLVQDQGMYQRTVITMTKFHAEGILKFHQPLHSHSMHLQQKFYTISFQVLIHTIFSEKRWKSCPL